MKREYQDRDDLSEEEQIAMSEGLSRIKIWGCYNITKSTYDECKNIPHTFYFKRLLTEQEEDIVKMTLIFFQAIEQQMFREITEKGELPPPFDEIPKDMFTGKMDCKMYFEIMDKTIELYDLPLAPMTSFMIKQYDIEQMAKKLNDEDIEHMAEYLSNMIENGVFDPNMFR
jgi:hypothetical protein